jgi:hypothetical protein
MTSLDQASPGETGEIGGMGSGVKARKVWAGRGLYSVSFRFVSFQVAGGRGEEAGFMAGGPRDMVSSWGRGRHSSPTPPSSSVGGKEWARANLAELSQR